MDAIIDIRRSSPFRRFRAAAQRAQQELDSSLAALYLQEGLDRYLVELSDLLALDLVGARHRYKRSLRMSRWMQGLSAVGGTALGGAGLVVPLSEPVGAALAAIGIVWGLAGTAAPEWLRHRLANVTVDARAALLAGPPSERKGLVQVSGQAQV